MGPVAEAVLLAMLLEPALLLVQELPGPATVEPAPCLNLKFDPWAMTLSWDCRENTTAVECGMIHAEKGLVSVKLQEKQCASSFWNYALHAGVTFHLTVNISQRQVTERLVYTNTGQEGTAAQNFSCVIYNANYMNCSWTKGPAAPDDVQYFLYVRDSKKQLGRQCPHYVQESGMHVGCHMQDVSSWASEAYFLVNGTSRHAEIRFFDSFLSLKTIERYNPPGNVTVHCNTTHCCIRWQKPRARSRLSDLDLQYQLQVQWQDNIERAGSQLIEVPGYLGNEYQLLSPQPRDVHTLRIRAADTRVLQWGAWSQPVTFGSKEVGGKLVHVYMLVVLGTVICALAASCLIQRLCRRHRLLSPVPQIKDKLNDGHQLDQVPWETLAPAAEKGDVEDLLTVEEVAEPTATTSDAATSASP
ncbi:granulocyte-macrophage colony-stimulating factor receptor subunit alpha isoform X1 [Rousettus aegyptiacus]|uniref:Fibronectin type-III domain-containing protein n=1 Tax=Rousettus aegyptiacus TaxID=9407 RepID=A0A7J8B881_ROUAE|nr:granulocyte-macrophage colony-stimulating factor receptor subunit alpha isoform X1 [Rousettus aegyptiacus]XP_016003787.2 granulocyte-macrophage colony-stimulating factor receptor subunit alpha isoform X1 [Rousettus aegyptiacus]XP_016003795.2 granulocyte-macrophage colony-stimulating factor receptor subunit alpha isoform X1 [Rousettus aegyptiacus]XP_036091625.1 granulocyte-macrophage colony-stimulating factor receptor subunit alpha isoform X1 [Rousettus aegyptiacus]KAF6394666.1 hypothetical p